MAGTQGVGTFLVDSKFSSGSLVFYEKTVGRTATGDVLTIGTTAVKVGGTSQDVDFQWYGTGAKSFILDLGAATAVSAGLDWTITGTLAVTGAITLTGDVSLEGDLTLTTEDVSVAQGRYIYLDGQGGGEYLVSDTANEATLNATTTLNLSIGTTDEVSISSTAVTLATNNLTLTAGNASVAQGKAVYLDGQAGGEYLVSDTANEATLNATTTLNLAIGATDEVSISSSAVTLATNDLTLTAGDASVAQGGYIYLDGQGGGEYLVSGSADVATLNATTTLNLAVGGTAELAVSASAVTLDTNDLTLSAGDFSVAQGAYVYLDGQAGGEYLVSDAANEATLNATTTLNLAIGTSDKISMTAATTTLNNDLAVTAGEFITGAPVKMTITNEAASVYLSASDSGLIRATADGIYLKLPTYIGNTGLTYFIKATATYTSGIYIYGYDSTENIDTANVWGSGAQSDLLGVIAHSAGWNIISKIGTWA